MKDVIAECLDSLDDFEKWDEKIFEVVCKTTTSCCAVLLEALDAELAKKRDKGLRMVGKRTKTVVAKFGSFRVRRRLYRNKDGTSRFLLDEALGLKPRTQATPSLEATVVGLASKMPFREAEKVLEETSGGILSHQMIHRIVQSCGILWDAQEEQDKACLFENGVLPKSKNKQVAHLFVEADGTMINLQRSTKKKAEVKLLVAHEGWEEVGHAKWALKDKTVISGFHSSDDIWERFTTRLLEIYEPEALRKLIIGGDGASWVKGGHDSFSCSLYQLDRFHLHRALLRATGTMKSACDAYILAAAGDLPGALSVLEKQAKCSPERTPDLNKAAAYLTDNEKGLVDYRERIEESTEDMRGLGAIESNIDKILANRMKKRGMAWTPKGAHHMAKVIQMRINGVLESAPAQAPKLQTASLKKALSNAKKVFKQDPGAWLAAHAPALSGPHQSRLWVKVLRNMTQIEPVVCTHEFSAY